MSSTWARVLEELKEEQKTETKGGRAAWAKLLLRKIKRVTQTTGRPLIIYGSACTHPKQLTGRQISIDHSDKIGFHDIIERVDGPNLDVLIHSPGGSAEAAETIVEEIRRKYSSVRFIVPAYAKSAATMMVMSGDEIVIDEDAELGPIDPQMILPNGVTPAEAIKEQFLQASKEILADPKKMSVWMPILQPFGPALLVQCENAIRLSKELVQRWLTQYMFNGATDASERAKRVADYLGDHANFASHGRRVKLEQLTDPAFDLGLKLVNLRKEPVLYQAVWELYCVMDICFSNTPMFKMFYNSLDDALVRQEAVGELVLQGQIPAGKLPLPLPPGKVPIPKM